MIFDLTGELYSKVKNLIFQISLYNNQRFICHEVNTGSVPLSATTNVTASIKIGLWSSTAIRNSATGIPITMTVWYWKQERTRP